MRAAGWRAGTTRWATWSRALRRLFARFDVVDLQVHRHPSRHSVERAHREAERRAAGAPVTPLELEERFEDLLEEWGRSA
jgi:hypothetical protein